MALRAPSAGRHSPNVKRAVALYGNKVYAATSDGRMVALDVQTGKVVWDQPIDNDVRRQSRRAVRLLPRARS